MLENRGVKSLVMKLVISRNINIIRNGKVIYHVDLYDYFSNGIYPNIYLRDQDVILVKPFKIHDYFNILNYFKI